MKKLHIVLFSLLMIGRMVPAIAGESVMDVYKSPYCGCCNKWIAHLEQNGFKVVSHDLENMQPIKSQYGVSPKLQSCHTGVIDGYFFEGHVPASDIKRFLAEKPDVKGLSVPGMPAGANVPGMEVRPENANFDVLAVGNSKTTVYAHYE